MKLRLASALLAVLFLAGCGLASILNGIAEWAPTAEAVDQAFAPLLAISNPSLAAQVTAIGPLIGDIGTAAAAVEAAGSNTSGIPKVIAEIQATVAQIQSFDAALETAGVNVSKNDQAYILGASGVILVALEGYEAVLEAKAGTSTVTSQLRDIHGECYGFETTNGHGPYHEWANCDPDNAIDATFDPNSNTVTISGKKPPSVGNFKRQIGALAKAHGHPELAPKVTMGETLKHVLTFGTR
jgi:hypothetical protein